MKCRPGPVSINNIRFKLFIRWRPVPVMIETSRLLSTASGSLKGVRVLTLRFPASGTGQQVRPIRVGVISGVRRIGTGRRASRKECRFIIRTTRGPVFRQTGDFHTLIERRKRVGPLPNPCSNNDTNYHKGLQSSNQGDFLTRLVQTEQMKKWMLREQGQRGSCKSACPKIFNISKIRVWMQWVGARNVWAAGRCQDHHGHAIQDSDSERQLTNQCLAMEKK
jgi:hypothetical protein